MYLLANRCNSSIMVAGGHLMACLDTLCVCLVLKVLVCRGRAVKDAHCVNQMKATLVILKSHRNFSVLILAITVSHFPHLQAMLVWSVNGLFSTAGRSVQVWLFGLVCGGGDRHQLLLWAAPRASRDGRCRGKCHGPLELANTSELGWVQA